MATQEPVRSGCSYCRDCGGSITDKGGLSWCENTSTTGDAVEPKDRCELLGMRRRNYCEQCGLSVNGAVPCNKGHQPTAP